eukprot:scaffold83893_cov31-Prasinocladus_malaysianus.AAC.1
MITGVLVQVKKGDRITAASTGEHYEVQEVGLSSIFSQAKCNIDVNQKDSMLVFRSVNKKLATFTLSSLFV